MLLLIIFAFLAGVVTILSPCILPILPIVLSGSFTGGKKRPLGIVAGFIVSFTFFTLFLTAIVKATGLSADVLRSVSIFILAGFGLSLLLPKFQVFTQRLFSQFAKLVPMRTTDPNAPVHHSDFLTGTLIGVSLGLIWTPCVGPILASIITLAATSTVSSDAVLITLAYATGTSVPLLTITYGGRSLLQKVPWLLAHSGRIQKAFGVLMIATALSIYLQLDRKFQAYILEKFPGYGVGLTKFEDNPGVREELEKLKDTPKQPKKSMLNLFNSDLGSAPEFIPGGRWFNVPARPAGGPGRYADGEPLTMEKLRGSVVLVDFWTYTCINCIRTLPYLKAWHEKYKDKGLVIVGVHTPEFEFEKNPANVQKAISDFGILYPVVQDNEYATWNAYANRYWPAKYLVDKTGKIRYTHFGEGAYDDTETKIQELLKEAGTLAKDMPLDNPEYHVRARTRELYLGYRRVSALASPERIQRDKPTVYTVPKNLPKNYFAFDGTWIVGDERAMPAPSRSDAEPGKGASLILHFDAAEVFLVARPKAEESHVSVSLDGKVVGDEAGEDVVKGMVTVTNDRLYKLIKLTTPGPHILQLNFLDDNLELYAFTFG